MMARCEGGQHAPAGRAAYRTNTCYTPQTSQVTQVHLNAQHIFKRYASRYGPHNHHHPQNFIPADAHFF